jgi:C_GCAxxG_C_C family probable redox protein
METKKEQAIKAFRGGLNCSQAVFTAYSKELEIDNNFALSVSCGFGGGMGRLQETCGVVTGAFMALGVYNFNKYTDNKERKEKTYAMVQDFNAKFIAIHKTAKCSELLRYDLKTSEGQKKVQELNLHEVICEKCIGDAIDILDEMMLLE